MVRLVLADSAEIGRPGVEPPPTGGQQSRASVSEATGPRPMPFAEAVEELAAATGRRVRYVRVSTEREAALLAAQDVPEEVVVSLTRVLSGLLDGSGCAARHHRGEQRDD